MLDETELIGNEIMHQRSKRSREDKAVDIFLIMLSIGAIAYALWGLIVTHSIPLP